MFARGNYLVDNGAIRKIWQTFSKSAGFRRKPESEETGGNFLIMPSTSEVSTMHDRSFDL
jgi:hypothetical protein